jgi:hypothetical protein
MARGLIVTTAFPVRGLESEVLEKLTAAAQAEGSSRNAYVVRVLTEHVRRIRPPATEAGFAGAAELASDLADKELMRAAWS